MASPDNLISHWQQKAHTFIAPKSTVDMFIYSFVVVVLSLLFVAEVQAIASMIEKQAQIVVKQKEVSEESKKRKEALLAQYATVTDEEEYPWLCRLKHQ